MFLQAPQGQPNVLYTLILWALLLAVFYFLLIRPQQQQQRRRREMLAKLKKGDRVVTVGGLHGTIVDVHGDEITLELAPNVRVRADRSAVGSVRGRKAEAPEKERERAGERKG
ncbi:MAG: preprotein translocase subunit YajC [Armatimonadota bacterium]|nr:preprotein translocase subunit YajC [Armatimonadota bacterium]MDR7445139.1 preprotein translocase subunit YajC [Armatimonadota bacterium]MDR7569786.1 preprotein translocase subunit YajC [Armatimonadota bacterium]MDR7614039.1 preprotein translocase subunit YajC [Armatimonadota bacterium]